ncbi:MAG: oligosaccharide flippase family protein [Patescibacteria group bacterium]|nr:oligosaccharide flippase family protein [Patescibacteria group bacterium]
MRKVRDLLKSPTSQSIAVNTLGNYLNVGFTALFTLVLFRILSPAEYGVYSVLITVSYVMATILDFGSTATIYSYLPPLLEDKGRPLFRFVKSAFYYQSILSCIVVLALLILFPVIDTQFLKTGASYLEMALTAIATLFFIWQNFILNLYFASKQFFKANLYLNIANIVKTIAIGVAFITGTLSIASLIFILGIFGCAVFYGLVLFDRRNDIHRILSADVKRKEFRFRYALTYFIASQFLNIGLRMDLFTISFFNTVISRPEVGYYAAAQKIILTVLTTVISITQVLSPGFSNISTRREARKQLRHGLIYMLIPSALFLGVTLTPGFIYEWFFTSTFSPSADIARVLSVPFVIYALGSVPMLFLLYTVKKPNYILFAYVTFFAIVTAGCLLLIPSLRLMAPVVLFTVGFLISKGIIGYACYREYRRLPR